MIEVRLRLEGDTGDGHLIQGMAVIGRHSGCEVTVKDPMASRRHAEIVVVGSTVTIKDLGAANPARVNGVAVKGEQQLHQGDIIGIGAARLRLLISKSNSAPLPTPPDVPSLVEELSQAQPTAINEDNDNLTHHPCLIYGGSTYPITGTLALGRHREANIKIADPRASRRHAEIGLDSAGTPWIRDLGTANGTLLNGKRLDPNQQQPLSHGDRLSIGASHLVLHLPRSTSDGEKARVASQTNNDRMQALIGRELAGYRLTGLIGEGSVAGVFKAQQLSLRREVAVKVFRPSVLAANGEFGDKLLEAARLAGRVEHDNVSRIHECGCEDDGLLWYSMELVDGESLANLVDRDGALAPELALAVIERLARALAAAHKLGICHWDIQPASALINDNGLVKLLDLGVGQVLQEGQQSSQHSMVVGNPAYMSPERSRGEPGDHRADMYSLGCLLHFLVTGLPPYSERNPVALLKAQQQAPLPSLINHGLPASIDSLLAGLMAKNPEWRFDSYDELLLEINQCKRQLGVASEELPPVHSCNNTHSTRDRGNRRPARRSRGTMVNVIIATAVIVGIIYFLPDLMTLLREHQRGHSETATHRSHGTDTSHGQGHSPQISPRGDTGAATARQVGDPDDWEQRWQQARERSEWAASEDRWAEAEYAISRLLEQMPVRPSLQDLRSLGEARLLSIRTAGSEWHRQEMASLPESLQERLLHLRRLRNTSLSQHRAAVDARFQSAVTEASGTLAVARRRALNLLEASNFSELRDLGERTLRDLRETPAEAMAQQFAALCEEASRLRSDDSWVRTRSRLQGELARLEGEQRLSAAAALMLDGIVDGPREILLAHADYQQGPLRLRRERLLRADTLILAFNSPVDLTFIQVEYGSVALDNGLRGSGDEPVGLWCTSPITGSTWETGVHLSIDQLSYDQGATISFTQDRRTLFLIRFDAQGATFVGHNAEGETEQIQRIDSTLNLRLRLAAMDGRLNIFLNDEAMLMGWEIPEVTSANLRLDADAPTWRLEQIHLLGPR
ncbi:MAG: FHA domain-containing protein [Planctomycetota bacterium]|nr:MAG: FHA domain-containing protein [Planctomycetota bacterium]